MKGFKKILLAQTTDPVVAAHAARIALKNQAQLDIIEVTPSLSRRERNYKFPDGRSLRDVLRSDAKDRIENLALDLESGGLKISTKITTGIPFIEIIKEAKRSRADLVVVQAEGSHSATKPMFGSMSMRLLRKCPCALWIINSKQKTFRNICAAIDPFAEDEIAEKLNDSIIDVAYALLSEANDQLSILAVWQSLWNTWAGRTGLNSSEIAQAVREEQMSVRNRLLATLNQHELERNSYKLFLRRGAARRQIVRFATQKKIDLMIMGTVCRTGIPGVLIGNTAESVLQHLRCSVLALKPEGFVSPVTA